MAKKPFPFVPRDLLEALSEAFPDRIPMNIGATIEDFRLLQGNQQVIQFLQRQVKAQEENLLKSP